MHYNKHFDLAGKHSFLSPSQSAWQGYDDEKLDRMYKKQRADVRGTRLHNLAHEHIVMGIKMPDTSKTLDMYVNDAIGFRMKSEQPLYYSANCFGTADTISYRDLMLRIHDLKSGSTAVKFVQLESYAALFFLEYGATLGITPNDIKTELRIYQSDDRKILEADPARIMWIMDKIQTFDKRINKIRLEEMA